MKRKRTEADNPASILLPLHLKELDIHVQREILVCKTRRFRWDFAEIRTDENRLRNLLSFDIHGGLWVQGHHNRGRGLQDDLHKLAEGVIAGWIPFVFSTEDVLSGRAREYVKRWLDKHS